MKEITIAKSISGSGIGLHKGTAVAYELSPLPSGSGIVFYRRDLGRYYEARAANVIDTQMATVLGDEAGFIATIEHLMSAIAAHGIDNLQITLDAPEAPVFDGSAAAWCALLAAAGTQELDAPKQVLLIKQPLRVKDGEKFAQLAPAAAASYDFSINFAHPAIGAQRYKFAFTREAYLREIAPARTFGFLRDVEALKARGLALGGSLENAVVIGDEGVLNPGGLRFSDEFVRHKILDAIGDIYMLGRSVLGAYTARAGSHALNNQLARAVLAAPEAYEILPAREFARAAFAASK